ncbi:MAG: cyclic nucleotide-binding domain-containing protein [Gammaproteobacteria bacterium]|nr:cyclic nucleotide-binding domain-containing protein [Gammaproteobacteria bacterium]
MSDKILARAKAVKILEKLPVFNGLQEDEYLKVLDMCSSTAAKAGTTLFKQGDDGSSMFIILSGEVDIIVKGVGKVHSMHGGDILGEIGLVKNVERTASAVVKTDCIFLHLYARVLHDVLKKYPRIGYVMMRNVARILAGRLVDKNEARKKAQKAKKPVADASSEKSKKSENAKPEKPAKDKKSRS